MGAATYWNVSVATQLVLRISSPRVTVRVKRTDATCFESIEIDLMAILAVADWPLLEDEWMLTVVRSGRRLAPELVPTLLARHRTDAIRHARALVAAGPLGDWMIEWSPRLACTAKHSPTVELLAELPELAIVPEFVSLLSAPPAHVARTLAGGLSSAELGRAHRAVLVNLLARMEPSSLPAVARAIDRVDPSSPSIGLAFALADLAHLRHHMLTELELA